MDTSINQILFIINAFDENIDECKYYINRLIVPQGFEISIVEVSSNDVTQACKFVMETSEARYKIYLNSNVFIINRRILQELLKCFEDAEIGLIGAIGGCIADSGNAVNLEHGKILYHTSSGLTEYHNTKDDGFVEVDAVDGMFMATQYDVQWNVIGNHHFNNHSIKVKQAGYKVGVYVKKTAWVLDNEDIEHLDFTKKRLYTKDSLYKQIEYYIHRMEFGMPKDDWIGLVEYLKNKTITVEFLVNVLKDCALNKENVLLQLEHMIEFDTTAVLFDQYQRYHTISNIIRYFKKALQIKKFNILEVGANVCTNLGKELKDDEIYYTDLEVPYMFRYDNRHFEADATELNDISDNIYDFTVCSDVLEHIPDSKRMSVIMELLRVSKVAVIICFPYKDDKVEQAEKNVNDAYKKLTGKEHLFLIEHITNGLPDRRILENNMKDRGLDFVSFTHGDVDIWKKMNMFGLFLDDSKLGEIVQRLHVEYNRNVYPYDYGKVDYRVFYIIEKNTSVSRYFVNKNYISLEKEGKGIDHFKAILQKYLA